MNKSSFPNSGDNKIYTGYNFAYVPKQSEEVSSQKGALNIGGQSKVVSVMTIATSITKIVGFAYLKLFATPFSASKSKFFAAKQARAISKFDNAVFALKTGKAYHGTLANIAKKEIFNTQTECEEGKELLRQCEKNQNTSALYRVDKNKSLEEACVDGICWGISLDIADDYLNGASVEQIAEKNKKGGSAKAAANQAVYEILIHDLADGRETNLYNVMLSQALSKLEENVDLSKSDILASLVLLDPSIASFYKKQGDLYLEQIKSSNYDSKKAIYAQDIKSINQAKNDPNSLFSLIQGKLKEKPDWYQKKNLDIPKFKAALIRDINRRYEKERNTPNLSEKKKLKLDQKHTRDLATLEWLTSYLEYYKEEQVTLDDFVEKIDDQKDSLSLPQKLWLEFKSFASQLFTASSDQNKSRLKKISNLEHRAFFFSILVDYIDYEKYQVVSKARGIQTVGVSDIMGHSSLVESDDEFLKGINGLPKGVYTIGISQSSGCHAITYIKDHDDPHSGGWILDPNLGVLRCADLNHTLKLFHILLAQYSEPKPKNPLAKAKGRMHHDLSFFQFKKA